MAATLKDFLRLCGKAGPEHCAFADRSPNSTVKIRHIAGSVVTFEGIEITYAVALLAADGYMTTVEEGYGFRGWGSGRRPWRRSGN